MQQVNVIAQSSLSDRSLFRLIRSGKIKFGGNRKLKIYGNLNCKSGKRMTKQNRVLFATEKAAIASGYRPCGHCMRLQYAAWKASFNKV
ncbi:Ada metal-binding domain-containing protein [Ekhidna sp.]|uniref:Ada metal-binding domain-containing protein n=1 Tax=Ekhidna sp. TaxID=2608089 RepID=UPI003299B17E